MLEPLPWLHTLPLLTSSSSADSSDRSSSLSSASPVATPTPPSSSSLLESMTMALDLLPVLEELGGLAFFFFVFAAVSSPDSFFLDLLFLLTGRRCWGKRSASTSDIPN